jgi:hypothetical protein
MGHFIAHACIGVLIMMVVVVTGTTLAQSTARAQTLPEARELVVGTKVAPPLAPIGRASAQASGGRRWR